MLGNTADAIGRMQEAKDVQKSATGNQPCAMGRVFSCFVKPKPIWFLAGWLPESGRAHVRRQSRHRLFRKTPGEHLRAIAKVQARHVSLCQPAREIKGQMGTGNNAGGHETLTLGQTRSDRPDKVYRVDA